MAGRTNAHRHSSSTAWAAAIARGDAGDLQCLGQPVPANGRLGGYQVWSSDAPICRHGAVSSRALLLGRTADLCVPICELRAVIGLHRDRTSVGETYPQTVCMWGGASRARRCSVRTHSNTVLAALFRSGSWARSNRCGTGLRSWHRRVPELRLLGEGIGFFAQICSCPARHSSSIKALTSCFWAPCSCRTAAACHIRSENWCSALAPIAPAPPARRSRACGSRRERLPHAHRSVSRSLCVAPGDAMTAAGPSARASAAEAWPDGGGRLAGAIPPAVWPHGAGVAAVV